MPDNEGMKTLVLLLALASTSVAFADEAATPEKLSIFAFGIGPAIDTKGGDGSHLSYGGRVGLGIGASDSAIGSLGLAVSTMSSSASAPGVTVDGTSTFLGAEYVARKAWGTGLYFGARAGIGLYSADISANGQRLTGSGNVFAFAPVLGFEAPIARSQAILVFDASWLNFTKGNIAVSGTSIPIDSGQALQLHAGLGISF